MNIFQLMNTSVDSTTHIALAGLAAKSINHQLHPDKLIDLTVASGRGRLTDNGTLAIVTGKFTGRAPKDRFIVNEPATADLVDWGSINEGFTHADFTSLKAKLLNYLGDKDIFTRHAFAGASKRHRLGLTVINEFPEHNLFAHNMFIRPSEDQLANFKTDWQIIQAPGFLSEPKADGTRQGNFAILCFSEQTIIIGGTGYTGEIKKGIFSALNFILPTAYSTLPMHCSANVGDEGDCALFFGLSGTGKTTLSADPNRNLIGDDEHGWAADGEVFNFEGGCYAKVINLSESREPDIWNAIKPCAILENITMDADGKPDYADASITQNTRVSYPIHHIDRIAPGGTGPSPKNIFFLTADAYGVLPPISKLTEAQAAYHFISGYTAKIAGTEEGITEPVAVFSACFGAPFMPLHPGVYAEMLMEKSRGVNVWLINTGWVGGAYGTGSRIKLKYTRAMIQAALNGKLDDAETIQDKVFGFHRIASCPDVPDHILNPRDAWSNVAAYDAQADMLAGKFNENFKAFKEGCSDDILSGRPLKS